TSLHPKSNWLSLHRFPPSLQQVLIAYIAQLTIVRLAPGFRQRSHPPPRRAERRRPVTHTGQGAFLEKHRVGSASALRCQASAGAAGLAARTLEGDELVQRQQIGVVHAVEHVRRLVALLRHRQIVPATLHPALQTLQLCPHHVRCHSLPPLSARDLGLVGWWATA